MEGVNDNLQAKSSGPEPEDWQPNYVLDGRYKIVERIAITGRCEVYKAIELQYPRETVVIKRLKPDMAKDKEDRERFRREAIILRQAKHQCVLSAYDVNKIEDKSPYFVTELADERSLRDYLENAPNQKLRPIKALQIASSVCQGLKAVHEQDIIHQDIKPGNILLFRQRDGSILAKLADFGIARVLKEFSDKPLADVGVFTGTGPYASPEQIYGDMADTRSDLYSWAIVFFEMLCGEAPIESLKDPFTFLPSSDDFPQAFFAEKGIPSDLITVLQKALNKNPELRYQSAEQVLSDLESIKSRVIATDIAQYLNQGEAHLGSQEWQAADAEFKQGLAACKWYVEPSDLGGSIGELAQKLQMGCLCVQGMMSWTKRQWPAAIDALEKLKSLDPHYSVIDITKYLKQAQSEQQFERKYQDIMELKRQGDWAQVYLRTMELTTEYKGDPQGESIGNIRKLALYAHGKELLEKNEIERAYHQFHRLYEKDPNYEDVAAQCATSAFTNAIGLDTHATREHTVEWLEKVLEIDPNHTDGHTRKQLDVTRFQWAKELLKENNKCAAVVQLEAISADCSQLADVHSTCVEAYLALGQQEYKSRHWHDAIEWWKKALTISPNLKGTLQWRIGGARIRALFDDHGPEIVFIGVIFTILTCIVTVWQPWQGGGVRFATTTPSATPTVAPTFTPIALILSPPTETPTVPSPTFTATLSDTPTPSPTSTPTPTHTYTPTPTNTPTRIKPTATSALTPTSIATTKPTKEPSEPSPTAVRSTKTPVPPEAPTKTPVPP